MRKITLTDHNSIIYDGMTIGLRLWADNDQNINIHIYLSH